MNFSNTSSCWPDGKPNVRFVQTLFISNQKPSEMMLLVWALAFELHCTNSSFVQKLHWHWPGWMHIVYRKLGRNRCLKAPKLFFPDEQCSRRELYILSWYQLDRSNTWVGEIRGTEIPWQLEWYSVRSTTSRGVNQYYQTTSVDKVKKRVHVDEKKPANVF